MKYSTIRKQFQHHDMRTMVFVDPYATLISPFITKICLKLGLIPNAVTVCMMLSGFTGAVLFAIPNMVCKILGAVFIHLWYVFDCSDGEVARITKRFSKYGTEIDYTAHILNHPLFILSFVISLMTAFKSEKYIYICILGFLLVALNLVFRNLILFYDIYKKRENITMGAGAEGNKSLSLKEIIMFFVNMLIQLPNFCLIFPIVYFINPVFALHYMEIVVAASIIYIPYMAIRWVLRIVNK